MLSSHRIYLNTTKNWSKKVSNTNLDNNSHREHDLKRTQLTSNDHKTTSHEQVKDKKNKLKGGANIENNEKLLDESAHNNYLLLDLARRINANDETSRSDTVQDLGDFNSQSVPTQAKKNRTTSFYDASY